MMHSAQRAKQRLRSSGAKVEVSEVRGHHATQPKKKPVVAFGSTRPTAAASADLHRRSHSLDRKNPKLKKVKGIRDNANNREFKASGKVISHGSSTKNRVSSGGFGIERSGTSMSWCPSSLGGLLIGKFCNKIG